MSRFTIDYEFADITTGIQSELTNTVGTVCSWWVYDSAATTVDSIYDMGAQGDVTHGRKWKAPVVIPVFSAIWSHGKVLQSERGYYNTDTIRFSFNSKDAVAAIPDLFFVPDLHVRDRIVYDGQVYKPVSLQPKGLLVNSYLVSSVVCQQVMPDEMINDYQFQAYV